MPEKDTNTQQDGLALIIGGLFVMALVFAAYNYFKSGNPDNSVASGEQSENLADENGNLNGDAVSDFNVNNSEVAGTSSVNGESVGAVWVANDYVEGDIKGNSYTVVKGDTLWEIAEAAYGDGTQWTKILDANSDDVGYLPNGSQALIVVGQSLIIP